MNELDFAKNAFTIIFIFDLLGILLASLFSLSIGNSMAISQLNGLSAKISNQSTNIVNALNYDVSCQILHSSQVVNCYMVYSGGWAASITNGLLAIGNVLLAIGNVLYKFFSLIYQIIVLMGYGIGIVVFLTVFYLPSIFNSADFGIFAGLFDIGWVYIIAYIGIYLYVIIKDIISMFFGAKK